MTVRARIVQYSMKTVTEAANQTGQDCPLSGR
jgi:hypothetical protein